MTIEQIRFLELLEDPTFKRFFLTLPKLPDNARTGGRLPWRLYVQRSPHGPWAKKDFDRYGEGARALKRFLHEANDLSLSCRSVSYAPPGRWVKLTKGGKPVWLTDDKGKPILRNGAKQQKQRLVEMKMPPGHTWCMYCRRPTVFTWFTKHHAFPKDFVFNFSARRCTICGITEPGPNDWKGTR